MNVMKFVFFLSVVSLSLNGRAISPTYSPARASDSKIMIAMGCANYNDSAGTYRYGDVYAVEFSPDSRTVNIYSSSGNALIAGDVPYNKATRTARHNYKSTNSELDVVVQVSVDKRISLTYHWHFKMAAGLRYVTNCAGIFSF